MKRCRLCPWVVVMPPRPEREKAWMEHYTSAHMDHRPRKEAT